MPPKTKKLFISYRSSDAVKVDKIAADLRLLRYDDGTAHFTTWQDKHDLPAASPHWWDAIVNAIIESDIFVFFISRASLESEVCRSELDYAHTRNRPIIPIVLEGEFKLDPKSGKYDIEFWEAIPKWLAERQLLFFAGSEFYGRFIDAVEGFAQNWPRDIKAPRPLNPDNKGIHRTNHALYEAACEYAEHFAFKEAKELFDVLARRNDSDYFQVAAEWLEVLNLYEELVEINQRRSARFLFDNRWKIYKALFPKAFIEGIFDPKNFDHAQGLRSLEVKDVNTPAGWDQSAPVKTAQVTEEATEEVRVRLNDEVNAGDWIGIADSTGNSEAAHLHLTLKKKGATKNNETPYPNDIIDSTGFLDPFSSELHVPNILIDDLSFLQDVTIPDNSVRKPGESFVKTWKVLNTGSSTWGEGYTLNFTNDEPMGAPEVVSLPTAKPGEAVNVSVRFTAPDAPGFYRSTWRARNARGEFFGTIFTVINVLEQ